MLAPVEVVYGVPTWRRTQRYLQGKLRSLDLWGSYQGIRLFLEMDSVETADRTSERQLQRFLIAAFHPQNLLRAWSNRFKPAQDTLLEVAYRLAGVQFIPQFFQAGLWQQQINVLPYAYFAANKLYEHESRLALKALHAFSLADADSEVRKRSTRLHAILNSELKRLVRVEGNQDSPESPFTPPSLSPSASTTILWPRKLKLPWLHFLRDSGDVRSVVCVSVAGELL